MKLSQSTFESLPNAHQASSSTHNNRRSTLVRSIKSAQLRTPSSASDLNRKTCADNVQKIIRILQYDKVFYNRLNLNLNNGLKSMSAKQFIDIIGHFIVIVSGKEVNTNRSSDCETEILNFIKNHNYACPVNKSWLKTPTAPHAYSECVALLSWMADFVGDKNDEHIMDAFYSNECDANFPNVECTQLFSKGIRNGFQLWNGQDDDGFEKWTDQLVESYVIASMKNRVRNFSELNGLVKDMNLEIEQLKEVDCTVHNESYFKTMAERMLQNEMLLKCLNKNVVVKSDKLASLKLVYGDKQNTIDVKAQIIERKQQILSKQRWSVDDYKLARTNELTLMQTIKLRRTEIETINADSRSYLLQMARLKQQKNDAIAKLNRIGFKMTQIILRSKLNVAFDANAIQIDSNASNDAVRMVCETMKRLIKCIQSHKQQNAFSIEQKKLQISKLKMLENHHGDRYEAAKVEFRKMKEQLHNFNEAFFQRQESCENTLREAEKQLKQIIGERKTLTEEIRSCVKRRAQMKQENENLLADGELRAAQIIQIKSKMIENLDEAIACIDEIVKKTD